MRHKLCHFIWGIWWFHRSKDSEAMKAGNLVILPWLCCPYNKHRLVVFPSFVVLGYPAACLQPKQPKLVVWSSRAQSTVPLPYNSLSVRIIECRFKYNFGSNWIPLCLYSTLCMSVIYLLRIMIDRWHRYDVMHDACNYIELVIRELWMIYSKSSAIISVIK
jgi:hypothetical protein